LLQLSEQPPTNNETQQPKSGCLSGTDGRQGTLAEVIELTGWQAHTVRGFVSGTLIKKLGLKIESFRSSEKERTYHASK
jgi:hypothetical protein